MVRAAAKNCDSVAIVTSPSQYDAVIAELKSNDGGLTKATRRGLARDAFLSTAKYDAAVSSYFCGETEAPASTVSMAKQTVNVASCRGSSVTIARLVLCAMVSTLIKSLLRSTQLLVRTGILCQLLTSVNRA